MMQLEENTAVTDTTPAPETESDHNDAPDGEKLLAHQAKSSPATQQLDTPVNGNDDSTPHQHAAPQEDNNADPEQGDADQASALQHPSALASPSSESRLSTPPPESRLSTPLPESRLSTPPPSGLDEASASDSAAQLSQSAAGDNKKKRKLADVDSESRPISPPWKKFGAEGPTAFLEDGKRRSGRVNALPIDLKPPAATRNTRSAHPGQAPAKGQNKATASPQKLANAHQQPATSRKDSRTSTGAKPTTNGTKPAPKKVPSRASASKQDKAANTDHDQDIAMEDAVASVSSPAKKSSTRPRKSSRVDEATPVAKSRPSAAHQPAKASPRITLKLRRTETPYVPQHPSHLPPAPTCPTLEESLAAIDVKEKELEKAAKVDENYQGLDRLRPAADRERAPEPTPQELAEKEARTRLRILEAAEPGGPLSKEKSSLYLPDEQPQPPPQYSHPDHLWAQASYFRTLLDREKRSHLEQAKKVAYAALAKWKEKQPQTEEEKEREERAFFETVYRQLVKDVGRKWELVGEEINRRRHARWEVEEKRRREKRMQEVMERSTNLLDARKAAREAREESLLSADSMDENDYDNTETPASGSDGEEMNGDSDIMSDSDDGSEEDGTGDDPDANLSPEALRRKYSTLPDLPQSPDPSDDEADDASDTEVEEEQAEAGTSKEEAMLDVQTPAQDTDAEPERDYSNIQLEEVDDALLDDSDESIDMSDEDMSDEDDDDDEEDEGSEEDEEDGDVGLLGFLGGRERKVVKDAEESATGGAEDVATPVEHSDQTITPDQPIEDATDQVPPKQLVPPTSEQIDASQHLSIQGDADLELAEPNDSTMTEAPAERQVSESSPDRNLLFADPHGEDRSSQLSVKDDTTAEPTEAESTTSIDLEDADKIAQSTNQTPQPTHAPKTKIPSLLRGTLREYQHEGLDWLAKLYANQTNGILADEMGLGKTIQTIALLAHLAEEHEIWGPHLIVVPTSVILNWEMEFKKFLPGFKVLSYYGTVEERAQKRKGWSNPDNYNVVITSYQLVLRDISSIKVPEWHYMILDEAHNIKNFNSARYRAMIRLKTHARLLLTGTPLQNNIQELWSLLTFLTVGHDGQGMGELHEFEEWFSKPVNEIFTDSRQALSGEAQQIVNKLHHSLRPYLLRRLKAHVEKQLPGKYEHTVICRLSKRQRQLYDAFMGLSDTKAKLVSGNMVSVSMALMALRKVCNHPDLFEERPIVTSFAMPKPFSKMPRAAIADYEIKNLLIRRNLLAEDESSKLDLDFLSLNLCSRERTSSYHVRRSRQLRASGILNDIANHQTRLLSGDTPLHGSSFGSILAHQNRQATVQRLDKIRKCAFLTKHRTDFLPVYGTDLVERVTIRSASDKLSLQPPRKRELQSTWYLDKSELLQKAVKTLPERAEEMNPFVCKFACITPNAVAENLLAFTTPTSTIAAIRSAVQSDLVPSSSLVPVTSTPTPFDTDLAIDPFHESRVRLSIAFPDKRLLQYDCGKLQKLALLLRSLTSRGSRALIFTQMTSVLDILESFLNIHGYKYLRLDGSTRIEQRQDMMERFNTDTKIDVFILSSRSGGVGMNLTGADTVIFYDLDWNPQMDRQCQDRAHRIGQMRDVHIYKFVSESTIEVNILKKSNQKRLLDEVVIQEGEFTTDWFKRPEEDQGEQKVVSLDNAVGDDVAGAAVDKFFGTATAGSAANGTQDISKVLESVEDAEDVAAARGQQKELLASGAVDEVDFAESAAATKSGTPRTASVPPTPTAQGNEEVSQTLESAELDEEIAAEKEEIVIKGDGRQEEVCHVDEYMLRYIEEVTLQGVLYVPPIDKKRARLDRNGRDRSHRAKRIR